MDIISRTGMLLSLLINCLKNKNRIILILLAVIILVWEGAALSASISEIRKTFDDDFGRIDPVSIKNHYKTIVENLSGIKIAGSVPIIYKPKGDVKNEWFSEEMESNRLNNDSKISGYEFLLKRLRLLPLDDSIKNILMTLYDDVYGLYDPSKKSIIFLEGTNRNLMPAILFHELMHAAQDEAIDIEKYQENYFTTLDSSLAASALLEGQAGALEYLVQMEKNLEDNTRQEAIEEVIHFLDDKEGTLIEIGTYSPLKQVRAFPYTMGFSFVLKRIAKGEDFNEMFEKVPATSEQVMHIDKFDSNEKPEKTILEEKINQIKSLKNCSLLLHTTLGEYYILQILNNSVDKNMAAGKRASEGWNGDSLAVIKNGKSFFLLWDTLWDTPKDAQEFYEEYIRYANKRFEKNEIIKDSHTFLLNRDG